MNYKTSLTVPSFPSFFFLLLSLSSIAQCSIFSWRLDDEFPTNLQSDCSPVVSPSSQTGKKEQDRVHGLPGQPLNTDFEQYSGYVNVDSNAGRALFYYFVESSKKASEKPLVLWLNGGPGCSSVGSGAFEELGPFRVKKDGKTLHRNPHSWNKEANIIFLESPAGVGFSYSNTTSNYKLSGDNSTAHDSYAFLVNWLERFPEYKDRDFFIAGESYAGHYVPQLANLIMHYNNCIDHTIRINLRGIAMGNALIDRETKDRGQVDFLWNHALLSDEIHHGLISNCDFSSPKNQSRVCKRYISLTNKILGDVYPYDIYARLCNSSVSPNPDTVYDPCSDNYVHSYLNLPQVQAALHANVTKLPYPWRTCSLNITKHWRDRPLTVLPLIQELMDKGLCVWLYSGDVDGVIPVTSTRYAIDKMRVSVKTPWYPWYTGGEVGGFAVEYDKNLTLVTVRGAGHFVPSYQPARAFTLFSCFIAGKLPPSKHS
ncbi:hypothetical protein V2J09_023890 [Rumex salicifolius]